MNRAKDKSNYIDHGDENPVVDPREELPLLPFGNPKGNLPATRHGDSQYSIVLAVSGLFPSRTSGTCLACSRRGCRRRSTRMGLRGIDLTSRRVREHKSCQAIIDPRHCFANDFSMMHTAYVGYILAEWGKEGFGFLIFRNVLSLLLNFDY